MPIFYLSGESPPSTFPLQFGQPFIFSFVIHFTKSKLIARPVPVLTLPERIHYSLRNISVTKKSSICRKCSQAYRSTCISNTQLTTFYCYSATNSVTNFSKKQLFFTKLKREYQPMVYHIPTLPYPCKKSLIPAISPMSRE